MAVPSSQWRVQPDLYPGHPGRWAYLEFEAWANKAERDGYFRQDQAKYIIRMFDKALQTPDPASSLRGTLNDCAQRGLITSGNVRFTYQKASEIFNFRQRLMQPQRSPGAASSSSSQPLSGPAAAATQQIMQASPQATPPLPIQQIQNIARTLGYVWFYKAPENVTTACFGNFFEVPGGVLGCRTAEGAFQAQKFVGDPFALFANLDGEGAWSLGKDLQIPRKADWRTGGNIQAMKRVLAEKFKPGSSFAAALLATGNVYLVEHTPVKGRDSFWSDDADGTGQNMLGKLLMEQRAVLGGTGLVPPPPSYSQNVTKIR